MARMRMPLHIGQRLLGDAVEGRGLLVGEFARLARVQHRNLQPAAFLHLACQVLQRREQAKVVKQGGAQVARHPAHLIEDRIQPDQRSAKHGRNRGALGRGHAQTVGGRLQQQLDRHQQLADAVVQLARQPRAFFFLRLHHALRQLPQLGVGLAVLAHIERQAAGGHQQDADRGNHADPGHGLADIGLRPRIELAQGALHVVEIDACAQHPVPLRHGDHVTQLGGQLLRGGLSPHITHRPTAGAGRGDQLLDGERALWVTQAPQILPDQLGLARVHQVAALQVVEKEVAVGAVVQARQGLHGGVAGGRIVVARAHHRRDRALRQFYVVAQLDFLALQVGRLDQRALVACQLGGLVTHGQRDAEHGHGERRDGQ